MNWHIEVTAPTPPHAAISFSSGKGFGKFRAQNMAVEVLLCRVEYLSAFATFRGDPSHVGHTEGQRGHIIRERITLP